MPGKEKNKYVKMGKGMFGFNIERGRRFLQVEGRRGEGLTFIGHNGYIIDNRCITNMKFGGLL